MAPENKKISMPTVTVRGAVYHHLISFIGLPRCENAIVL